MPCVLAQLTNSAAQPKVMMLRKRRVVGFIDSDLSLVARNKDKRKKEN
jgi:hypothetical protein